MLEGKIKFNFILYKFTISLFVIAQKTAKARIIANLLKMISEFFLIFERKWFKYMPEKGHFGEHDNFCKLKVQIGWVFKLSKWLNSLHAVVFHVYKEIKGL